MSKRGLLIASHRRISGFPLAGAAIDLWFANNQYTTALSGVLSCSRASIGYAKNLDGTLTQFGNDTLRIGVGTGLLVEDARTNLIYPSVPNSGWSDLNTSHSINAIATPDATVTATSITEDGSTSEHYLQQTSNRPLLTDTNTYTLSCFLKAGTRTFAIVQLQNSDGNIAIAGVNLSTGVITDVGANGGQWSSVSATAEPLSNDWFRVVLTATLTAGGNKTCWPMIALSHDGLFANRSYVGDGSSYIYAWGVQLEQASFASSYIPTTTGAATRAADIVLGVTDSTLYNIFRTDTCSVVMDVILNGIVQAGYPAIVFGRQGGGNPYLLELIPTVFRHLDASYNELNATLGNSLTFLTGVKVGFCQDTSGRSLVGGGGSISSDANYSPSPNFVEQEFGTPTSPPGWFGYFRRFTAWNTRLADATLQGFTAP